MAIPTEWSNITKRSFNQSLPDTTMKVTIVFLAVLGVALAQDPLTTAQTVVVTGGVAPGGSCTKTTDCGEGYCCVTKFIGKKKRFIFDDLFGSHNSGKCEPERKENDSCHVFMDHDIFNPDLFEDYCPCMTGLECRGETVDETGGAITHHNPKCQPKSGSSSN
ncbi:uncharacterized protein [Haliotis cracherodii]|uniref:uncharacterized protein n=1 Tax=Haliotis cracherodii TaxID=6455 RepID=UPI0039E7DE97